MPPNFKCNLNAATIFKAGGFLIGKIGSLVLMDFAWQHAQIFLLRFSDTASCFCLFQQQ
jgi:hypothetical protein